LSDGLGVHGLLIGGHGSEHGLQSQVLHQPSNTAAMMEDLGDGRRFKDGFLASGGFEVAL
jgi:hypothetical protein